MDSPPPAPLPSQPPPAEWAASPKGLALVIAAVALVIICLCSGWFFLTRFVDKFTATQPAAVEVRQSMPAEGQAAEAKWKGLGTSIRNNHETTVEFTADELNALIATDPEFRKVRGRLRIGIGDSMISLDLSAPLDSLKWTLRGRWFNGNIRFGMSYVDDNFLFDVKSAEANGRQIPSFIFSSDFERSFSRSFSQSFRRRSESRPDRDAWLKHIRTISVQDDKFILTTRPI